MKAVDFLNKYRQSNQGPEASSEDSAPRILKLSNNELMSLGLDKSSPGQNTSFTLNGIYKSRTADGGEIEIQEIRPSQDEPDMNDKPPIVRLATEPKAS